MLQGNPSIRMIRCALSAFSAIFLALLLCMAAAALIESGKITISWSPYLTCLSLFIGVLTACVFWIGRRGERPEIEIAITCALIVMLLLLLKLSLYPDNQVGFTKTLLTVLAGGTASWLAIHAPNKRKKSQRRKIGKRK